MSRRCPDCGARGEREGHMECPYPGLKLAERRIPRDRRASRDEQRARVLDSGHDDSPALDDAGPWGAP